MKIKPYQNYLFDADGTLLDTGELVYQSFKYTCNKYGGISVDRSRVFGDMGQPLVRQIQLYLGTLPTDRLDTILSEFRDYQLDIYPDYLSVFPGVVETLEKLHQRGNKLAVVTSRRMETAELYLKECGLFKLFHVIITPEATSEHKPHPEPALKALELLNGVPEESLFVGDAYFDIECGQRAGTDTAFVAWSANDPATVRPKPTYIINEMNELLITRSVSATDISGDVN